MIDTSVTPTSDEAFEALKARADALEYRLQEAELHAQAQLRQFELKAEAMRAGIVDLDGLRLIAPRETGSATEDLASPASVINKLRHDKPWLFSVASSSSVAAPPTAVPTKRRLATDMTVEEWRAARSELLRRR